VDRQQLVWFYVSSKTKFETKGRSVPDPDPHVFGPPGSGSISQRYGSGSGCFVTSLELFILKNDVNVPSKSNKQKNFEKN
jgi:hypothetical protein